MINNMKSSVRQMRIEMENRDIKFAKEYVKGAVHSFCKNNSKEPFSVRILFGGANKDWHGTALQCIYEYYRDTVKDPKPANRAAIYVGYLLKSVLNDDRREFECVGKDTGNKYRLVK